MTKPNIDFQCQPFTKIPLPDWYSISQAREQVFIVEQNCPYLDSDGLDLQAWHVSGYAAEKKLACYARILPPEVRFTTGKFAELTMPAIGRVLTVADYRGHGLASDLMKFAISQTHRQYPNFPIYISAQVYLTTFYQNLGFVSQGESYLEDGIPHIDMILWQNFDKNNG